MVARRVPHPSIFMESSVEGKRTVGKGALQTGRIVEQNLFETLKKLHKEPAKTNPAYDVQILHF